MSVSSTPLRTYFPKQKSRCRYLQHLVFWCGKISSQNIPLTKRRGVDDTVSSIRLIIMCASDLYVTRAQFVHARSFNDGCFGDIWTLCTFRSAEQAPAASISSPTRSTYVPIAFIFSMKAWSCVWDPDSGCQPCKLSRCARHSHHKYAT